MSLEDLLNLLPEREDEEDDDEVVDVGGDELAPGVQVQDLGGPVELDNGASRVQAQRILAAKFRLESDQVNLEESFFCYFFGIIKSLTFMSKWSL